MGLGILPIVVTLTIIAAVFLLRQRGQRLKPPWATFVVAAITLGIGAFAIYDDVLLDFLKRDVDRLAAGEWWRLITPLVGQDGGLAGLIFNVVVLLFAGAAVENLFGPWIMLGVYLSAGIVSEVAAYTIMPGQGYAGNSVACLGLAGMLALSALFADQPVRLMGIIATVAGLFLLIFWDLHGIGFLVGALFALAYWLIRRRKPAAAG